MKTSAWRNTCINRSTCINHQDPIRESQGQAEACSAEGHQDAEAGAQALCGEAEKLGLVQQEKGQPQHHPTGKLWKPATRPFTAGDTRLQPKWERPRLPYGASSLLHTAWHGDRALQGCAVSARLCPRRFSRPGRMEACTAQPLLTAGLAAGSTGPETPEVPSNP